MKNKRTFSGKPKIQWWLLLIFFFLIVYHVAAVYLTVLIEIDAFSLFVDIFDYLAYLKYGAVLAGLLFIVVVILYFVKGNKTSGKLEAENRYLKDELVKLKQEYEGNDEKLKAFGDSLEYKPDSSDE